MMLSTPSAVAMTLAAQRGALLSPGPQPHGPLCRLSPRLRIASGAGIVVGDDEDAAVKYGRKSYWDDMYEGRGEMPAGQYSWYCGFDELRPFWEELVPSRDARILVPGTGNDGTIVGLYDWGWTDITAFDYSDAAIRTTARLFGDRLSAGSVSLLHADARSLPFPTASFDATLDKGALDAIYIAGRDSFRAAVRELGRITAPGGVVVSVSHVIVPQEMDDAFAAPIWEMVHDGGLAFAPDGEATIDLGAELFSWRRTEAALPDTA